MRMVCDCPSDLLSGLLKPCIDSMDQMAKKFFFFRERVQFWVWICIRVQRSNGEGYPLQYSCLESPHRQRSLAGYSPWSHKELDTPERLSTAQHFYYSHFTEEGTEAQKCYTALVSRKANWINTPTPCSLD